MLKRAVVIAVLLGACQPVGRTAEVTSEEGSRIDGRPGSSDELPELAPPDTSKMISQPALPHISDGPPLARDLFFGWSCEEIAAWAGLSLPSLSSKSAGGRTPVCAVEGSLDDRPPPDPSGRDATGMPVTADIHVLYLPPGGDPTRQTAFELIAEGMVDLIISLTPRDESRAPTEARPNETAGGYAPFDVRGERGVVQRGPGGRVTADWWEGTERGRLRHVVLGSLEPEETVAIARAIERSPTGPANARRVDPANSASG